MKDRVDLFKVEPGWPTDDPFSSLIQGSGRKPSRFSLTVNDPRNFSFRNVTGHQQAKT